MICNEDGIIIKIDNKGILEFLNQIKNPLILFGIDILNSEGKFTIDILLKNEIKIDAIGDCLIENQNQEYAGISIDSFENLCEKYKEKEPVIWIILDNMESFSEIYKRFQEKGFYNIMNFNIMNPVSERYYYDFNDELPIVFIGDNIILKKIKNKFEHNRKVYYIDILTDDVKKQIEELLLEYKKCNWIICDEKEWINIIYFLQNKGVFENIYRYVRGIYGEFDIQKYKFLEVHIRRILYNEMAFINSTYYMISNEMREIYKKICKKYLMELTLDVWNKNEIIEILKTKNYNINNRGLKYIHMKEIGENPLTEFYNFLKFIRVNLFIYKNPICELQYNEEKREIIVKVN